MSFLSAPFLLFVLASVAAFQLTPARHRRYVLLGASLVFYSTYAPPWALVVLFVLSVACQRAALAIERTEAESKKLTLAGTMVTASVLVLAAYKVSARLVPPTTGPESDHALHILIPLGISYYTFKLIAYVLEVYWGNLRAEHDLPSLVLYASFFPQIVSGPIERPGPFFEQSANLDRIDPARLTAGLRRILFGLFKKIAIADRLAPLVLAVHETPGRFSSLELLVGGYVFAIQLYADFSGLTDIALGLGRLFGIEGPENFELPFFAPNLQEYWRRWHM